MTVLYVESQVADLTWSLPREAAMTSSKRYSPSAASVGSSEFAVPDPEEQMAADRWARHQGAPPTADEVARAERAVAEGRVPRRRLTRRQ